MQTVFRVKRRLDEKQLSGLQIAKRQKLESDVPLLLTFAGTTPGDDTKTALSVIRRHQAGDGSGSTRTSHSDGGVNEEVAAIEHKSGSTTAASSSLTDVDELFRIYDAYQKNITELNEASNRAEGMSDTDTDGTEEARSEFVYDIYYLSKGPTSDRRSMCIDFTTEQFRLEQWGPENDELVDDEDGKIEAHEDDDSNAEDNPRNDYPDEEDWYSDNGGEIPHMLDDDDYYSYESHDHLSPLEQRMRDLNFFGEEDGEG